MEMNRKDWLRGVRRWLICECSVTQRGAQTQLGCVISELWQSSGGNCTGGWSCDCTGPSARLTLSQQLDSLTTDFSNDSGMAFHARLLLRSRCNNGRMKLDHLGKSRLFPLSVCFVYLFMDWIIARRCAIMNIWTVLLVIHHKSVSHGKKCYGYETETFFQASWMSFMCFGL